MKPVLWGLVLFLAFAFPPFKTYAEPSAELTDNATGADIVLLIDTSGSMRRTDPNRNVPEAAILFIEMMETENSRIGVVEFTGVIEYSTLLTPLSDTDAIEEMKRRIDGFVYHGFTDLGLALKTGTEILLAEEETLVNPMMIMFTDGITEISPIQAREGRTIAGSNEDVKWSLNELDGRIPVHTVGLNNRGDVDVPLLEMIAEHSTATATFTINAAEMPGIFADLYRRHVEGIEEEAVMEEEITEEETPVITPAPTPDLAETTPEETKPDDIAVYEPPFEIETDAEVKTKREPFNPLLLALILVFVIAIVMLNVRWFLRLYKNRPPASTTVKGTLDILVVDPDGLKHPRTTYYLDFSQRTNITFTEMGLDLENIYLTAENQSLVVVNKGGYEISDSFAVLSGRKIQWQNNMRLTFVHKDSDDMARVEIIYK